MGIALPTCPGGGGGDRTQKNKKSIKTPGVCPGGGGTRLHVQIEPCIF